MLFLFTAFTNIRINIATNYSVFICLTPVSLVICKFQENLQILCLFCSSLYSPEPRAARSPDGAKWTLYSGCLMYLLENCFSALILLGQGTLLPSAGKLSQ